MLITHDNFDSTLLSGRLWRGMAPPEGMGPWGNSYTTESGNTAFGFFDQFMSFHTTTLIGPYLILKGTGCTVEQVADTATEKGLVQLTIDGDADNDEAVLQWGRGLGAPFKLANKDLAFECRFTVSATTASKWDMAVGLGDVSMGTTDLLFTDSDVLADKNFLGFVKLLAESTDWDGAYKAAGQTYQDGATKTKLNALKTMTATTYTKLGFRYRANPATVEWYVDNVRPGGLSAPARLTATEVAAATFPTGFLAPIIGIKDGAGTTGVNIKLDWWACAQML
jgi:hypothetical protein